MFDISPINTPISTFATAKNSLMTRMMEEEIKQLKQTPFYVKHLSDSEKKKYIDDYIKKIEKTRAEMLKNPQNIQKFLGRQNWMTDEDVRKFL